MTRREARQEALLLIFEYSFRESDDISETVSNAAEIREVRYSAFSKRLFFGVYENKEKIDAYIEAAADNWSFERISRVSLSVLRLCVYEMLYEDDIDENISINEAIELAKSFDDDKAPQFVNGVLGKIYKNIITEREKING